MKKPKKKLCSKYHHVMLQEYGMKCALCDWKVIWDEKVKKSANSGNK